MCFSAGASFAGGAMIASIGVMTVRHNHNPSRKLFAAVPLVFGMQQFSEGFVWAALQSNGSELMLDVAAYFFLFTALVLWPTLIPLAVMRMEPSPARRRAMIPFLMIGAVVSLWYGIGLLLYKISPEISSHHIKYSSTIPKQPATFFFIAYLLATLVPLFISGVKRMTLFGALMAASCLVTGIFYKEYLTSVWCFFAASISLVILWIIISEGKREREEANGAAPPGG